MSQAQVAEDEIAARRMENHCCSSAWIGLRQARAGFATCCCTVESCSSSHFRRNGRTDRHIEIEPAFGVPLLRLLCHVIAVSAIVVPTVVPVVLLCCERRANGIGVAMPVVIVPCYGHDCCSIICLSASRARNFLHSPFEGCFDSDQLPVARISPLSSCAKADRSETE